MCSTCLPLNQLAVVVRRHRRSEGKSFTERKTLACPPDATDVAPDEVVLVVVRALMGAVELLPAQAAVMAVEGWVPTAVARFFATVHTSSCMQRARAVSTRGCAERDEGTVARARTNSRMHRVCSISRMQLACAVVCRRAEWVAVCGGGPA